MMSIKSVSEQTLLEGSWFALEQAGLLLRDAVQLFNAGAYPSAVVLALLGREEMGRSRLLRKFSAEVAGGAVLTVAAVNDGCSEHAVKQRASAFSIVLTPRNDSVLGKALGTYGTATPGSPEWEAAERIINQASEAQASRQSGARHEARCEALYVDLEDNGTDWNRPVMAVGRDEAERHINHFGGDYANERDRITNTDLHAMLAEHKPHLRAREMHAANQALADPVDLPPVSWLHQTG